VTELSPLAEGEVSSGTPLYRLQLDDGSQLSAGLVVAADGALSSIRRLADVTTREWDYEHVATVATIETESSHQQTAWQRFMPEGPLAFLPLANGTDGGHFCSIVWSAQPDLAERIAVMDDAQFCAQLGRAFEYRLGEVLRASPRRSFPLRQRHATCYYKTGLALVGDAAHTIHPLAGQGINLGLKDVAVLAQELKRAVDLGLAPGLPAILGRFQRRRQADNLATMVVMDGFKRLFGERSLGIRWLRNSGMNQLNRAPLLKRRIMRQAMGL
jgi:2-octaprenylphenol hydroxylase